MHDASLFNEKRFRNGRENQTVSMTPEMPIIIRVIQKIYPDEFHDTFCSHCETSEAASGSPETSGANSRGVAGGRVAARPFGRREIQPSRRTCACSTVSAWDFPCIPTVYSYQDYNHLMLFIYYEGIYYLSLFQEVLVASLQIAGDHL